MRVSCSKCSRPIALTDNIESSDGYLSHTRTASGLMSCLRRSER
jgi:hypothetical protein